MWRDKAWLGGVAMNSHRDATATARDRTFTAALSHDFGSFRLAGAFQRGQWEATRTAAAPASSTAFFSRDYRSMMVGGTVQLSPSLRLASSLKRYDDRTNANFDATQATVLVSYAFSKRTDLYAGHSRLKNATGGAYAIQDGTTTYSGVLTGADPTLTALGIRHSF
jgi:predicted porin